jgi:hypothetical protein
MFLSPESGNPQKTHTMHAETKSKAELLETISKWEKLVEEGHADTIYWKGRTFDLIAQMKQISAMLNQPVQHTGSQNGKACDILRADCRSARDVALSAIASQ